MERPTISRAAVLETYDAGPVVRELQVPELEPDAILVKVEAATMCGSDVHIADGDFKNFDFAKLPLVMGHEIIGRIVELGRDRRVDALNRPLSPGSRIAWSYRWCGSCYWCTVAQQPTLCENARMYGWGPCDVFPFLVGGFSEYAYVMPRCQAVLVPDNVESRVASSTTCAFRTVIHAYEELGGLGQNDTVLIQGTGPVGLYALAYAIRAGVKRVICFGAPEDRLSIASRWGATHAIDVRTTSLEDREELMLSLTDGRGPDVIVECSGVAAAFEEGFGLLRRGGSYLVVGQAEPRLSQIQASHINARQLRLVGSLSGDIAHYIQALDFVSTHADQFDFDALLGNTYGLDRVGHALASLREGREPKPVVVP